MIQPKTGMAGKLQYVWLNLIIKKKHLQKDY